MQLYIAFQVLNVLKIQKQFQSNNNFFCFNIFHKSYNKKTWCRLVIKMKLFTLRMYIFVRFFFKYDCFLVFVVAIVDKKNCNCKISKYYWKYVFLINDTFYSICYFCKCSFFVEFWMTNNTDNNENAARLELI